jgi:predicted CXXCH cytochrome family protein
MAMPAFADGGPHVLPTNGGTGPGGLTGDCASCHRAHTSQATDLLKSSQPGLCLSCHDGTGATADVVDGYQFVPNGIDGQPTGSILGALRGGGFSYALLDTAGADRLSYSSRGGQTLTFGAAPGHFSMTLTWAAFGSFGGGSLNFFSDAAVGTVQSAADTLFGTSATYSGSTSLAYMTGLPAGNSNVVVTKSGNNFTFAPNNGLRLAKMPLPSVTNGTATSAVMTDGISVGNTAHVGVLAAGEPVTSTHLGAGTVWGNGPQGQGNAGSTGVTLMCTNCHNPHGNGQYRILNTLPGEDWVSGTGGVASWTAPTNDVDVIDGPALTGIQVHNYTIKPGYLAQDVTGAYTVGDYFRYKYDPSGATNFTNFYLLKDPMNSGWNGQTPTNAAAIESIPNTTLGAALTASATSATVATTAGMPTHTPTTEPQPLFLVKIDSEILSVSVTNGTTLKISRAQYGTTAAAHSSGAAVIVVGTGPSQDNADVPLYNNLGRMTAWCITCHTRYNGWAQNGTSSLNAQTPSDAIYGFKHGTTSTGCEQCHVNHGTNAVMTGPAADVPVPGGNTPVGSSSLLKVNNRGTCQLCHDPTGTVEAGTVVGTVPPSPVPGP